MANPKSQIIIEGTVFKVFEPREITGKEKTWLKQDVIIEIPGGNSPRKLLVEVWGEDKINNYDLEPGLIVRCFLDLESKERGDRWFTHAQAWKITWDNQPRRNWTPGQNRE